MDLVYNVNPMEAQPGDIVMSNVGKVKHHILELGVFKEHFLLFVIVSLFSYHDKTVGGMQGCTRDHVRLKVCWKNLIKGDYWYVDKRNVLPPVTIEDSVYIDKEIYPPAVCKNDEKYVRMMPSYWKTKTILAYQT